MNTVSAFYIVIKKFKDPVGFSVPFSRRETRPAMVSSISSRVDGISVLSNFTVKTIKTISARASERSKSISPL